MTNPEIRPSAPARTATPVASAAKGTKGSMPVEFIELALGLELMLDNHSVFADAVKAAMLPLNGEFLFELPQTDQPDGKGRIAAIRLAYAGSETPRLAFVLLAADGIETSVEPADSQPDHLKSFAEAFVDVIEKFGKH